MKKNLAAFLLILCLAACGDSEPQNKHLVYQNIVILSDLSSRIDNKPPKDVKEIHKIVQFFNDNCVKPGEKIGDKSSISFAAFSDDVTASVDNEKIRNLGEKQQFINSTGKYQKTGLKYEIRNFEKIIEQAYATTRNQGLDLISILLEKIENGSILKHNTYLTDGVDTTFINYDNHIYVFTDGYLEYLNKNANKQFYFGGAEIEKVRKFCRTNNADISKALEMNPDFCLPANKNPKNKNIILHVMETHERDKNDKLQTYKNVKGLRDNEILEAVWYKWAIDSGFKDLKWDKY